MATRALITVEEFERLVLPDDRRAELDEGVIKELTFPNFRHNRVAGTIYSLLREHVRQHKLGEVFLPDAGFRLSPITLRGPDVSFLSNESLKRLDPSRPSFGGAPDLAIEVWSPSDKKREMARKLAQYFAAGAREAWVVYPDGAKVDIYAEPAKCRLLQNEDLLGTTVLPDFRVVVSAFFADV